MLHVFSLLAISREFARKACQHSVSWQVRDMYLKQTVVCFGSRNESWKEIACVRSASRSKIASGKTLCCEND